MDVEKKGKVPDSSFFALMISLGRLRSGLA